MLKFIEVTVVDQCNLNCARCCHFTPLVKANKFKDLTEFELEIRRFAEICHTVPTINLLGGEPLLHPQIEMFGVIIKKYIPDAAVTISTNGLLLGKLTDKQVEILNDSNVYINVSEYPIGVNVHEFEYRYKNITYYPIEKMYNISLDLSGSQNINDMHLNCDQACHRFSEPENETDIYGYGCLALKDGKLYPCSLSANIGYFQKHFHTDMKEFEDAGIDIFRHTEEEIEEYVGNPHNFCKYCMVNRRWSELFTDYHASKKQITEWVK